MRVPTPASTPTGAADMPEVLHVSPYLNDPAVHRRVRMLRLGGAARIRVLGFRRTPERVTAVAGVPAIDLGRTRDGRLARRVVQVAAALLRTGSWARRVGEPTVVVARSLEALLLASTFRNRFAPRAPLVYETLDIHPALLGSGAVAVGLRRIEANLLAECALVVTSSPAFVSRYFERFHRDLPEIVLLENRMLCSEMDAGSVRTLTRDRESTARVAGPPWRIGWFGLLRCPRSLRLLAGLCRRFPGKVEVDLRGRPAIGMSSDFADIVDRTPGMNYGGAYDRARDLPGLCAGIHYSWTLDFSESGANSDWLLPNRLYETGAFGCVPLALRGVETGRWLQRRGCGVLLDEPVDESLDAWFGGLDGGSYAASAAAVLRLPMSDFVDDADAAAAFVRRLGALPSPPLRGRVAGSSLGGMRWRRPRPG